MKSLKTLTVSVIVIISCLTACKKTSDAPKDSVSTNKKDSIMYDGEFNGPDKTWTIGNNTSSIRTIANGYYTILNKDPENFYDTYTNVMFYGMTDKIAMETSLKVTGGNTNYPAFGGLVWNCRVGGTQLGVFGYYNDGTYEIFAYDEQGNFTDIKAATASTAIKKNDFNLLRMEQRSGIFHFLINGTEVYSKIRDTTATNVPGKETLDIPGIEADPGTTTTVDYFKTYKLY